MAERETIQGQLDALKGVFLAQLGSRIGELEAAWSTGAFADTHRLAHKLAGTAGTFGVAGVSALARELECLLAPAREGTAPDESARGEAQAILRQLREAASDKGLEPKA